MCIVYSKYCDDGGMQCCARAGALCLNTQGSTFCVCIIHILCEHIYDGVFVCLSCAYACDELCNDSCVLCFERDGATEHICVFVG